MEEWRFNLQDEPKNIEVYSNSDWVLCAKSRRNMSTLAIRYGNHLLDMLCAKQNIIALSSDKTNYYALIRAALHGLLVKGIFIEINIMLNMNCRTDSSAAKGITARKGVGRIKYLSLKELWIQDVMGKKKEVQHIEKIH